MNELRALIVTEAKLLFREPVTWLGGHRPADGHPADLRLDLRPPEPDPALGGLRFIDVFVPSLVVITVGDARHPDAADPPRDISREGRPAAALDDAGAPVRLLGRAAGHLPGHAVIAAGPAGRRRPNVAFAVPLPGQPVGYVAAFLLGMASLFAIGLLVAAVAPSSRAATAIAIPMFFVVMFLGGVYLPRRTSAGRPGPDRRLHPARRPGPPGRVAGHRAPARAARSAWPASRSSSAGRRRPRRSAGSDGPRWRGSVRP